MIKKFIKIKNLGRFKDFSATGDITFGKVNIIYGENSQGKTTLVSIIRSLISQDAEFITKRKTFGSEEEQVVELLFTFDDNKNSVFNFQNSKWDLWHEDLKNIEIFDEFFVNENIYTGLEIHSEHQKCLYHFAIGEEGVKLAKEIENIKEELNSKYPELTSLREKIKLLTGEYYKVEDFVNLFDDKEIDKKIAEKKQEISIAEASNEIKEKQFLKEIQSLKLPFNIIELKSLLEKSLTSISEKVLQRVREHIIRLANVLQENTESWLYQGLEIVEKIKDDKCPFCQQDLKNAKTTIESYQQYFNSEYNQLKKNVDKYLEEVQNFNFEQPLNKIKTTVLENTTLIEFWKRFLPNSEFPTLQDLEEDVAQVTQFFNNVKLLTGNKSKNILESIETDNIDKLSNLIDKLNKKISDYNLKVRTLNEKIKELKEKQQEINKLRNELKKLEIQKERFSEKSNELCNKYRELNNEIEKLKKQIEQNKEKLNTVICQKVVDYGERTNQILEKFGVSFKIIKPTYRYRGRGEEPYYEYFLESEECEVDPLQKAKFTLSGGDKNAIALAFFLAKIISDKRVENKIVIFDDPISSFDINRKRRTIEFMRELSQKTKQTIILTHLNTFAFELYDSMRDVGTRPKCLQIINGDIKEWDIIEEKKHPFFKNLSKLESYINNKEKVGEDEVRRLIRICLEYKLKFNYFQFFSDLGEECVLGSMVEKLRKLKDDPKLRFKHPSKEEVIEDLGNLCDFSSPSHHGNIATSKTGDSTRTEIENYVKLALKLIYEWL